MLVWLLVASAAAGASAFRAPALGMSRVAMTRTRAAAAASEGTTVVTRADVAVIGGGPAGSIMAWALAEREGLKVVMIDAAVDAKWRARYGVWVEEWAALAKMMPELDLEGLVEKTWPVTDCYLGGSWGVADAERTRLQRAYHRVDRAALRAKLRSRCADLGVETVVDLVTSLQHDAEGSDLRLRNNNHVVRATHVIDCTGAETRLTKIDRDAPPRAGYQIAYGIEAVVEAHEAVYPAEAMVLFDYRTDHLEASEQKDSPTFMYAMPLDDRADGKKRIFFEETSLVARPGLSLKECERRCFRRLNHLGIDVLEVEEVELCYIPMGGALPTPGARIVPFGAAASLVHPATGYQLCRAMAAALPVAAALGRSRTKPAAAARAAHDAMWNRSNRLQRDFAVFGGEFLMEQDVEALRGWFIGFFKLDEPVWAGFLAGWPGLPGNAFHETRLSRLIFGLQLIVKLPPSIALKLASFILSYTLRFGPSLMRSVTPFFGDAPPPLENNVDDNDPEPLPMTSGPIGDLAVKAEMADISKTLDRLEIEKRPLKEPELATIALEIKQRRPAPLSSS